MKFMFAAVLLAAPTMALAEPIDLVCRGTATTTESEMTHASAWNNDGDSASGWATKEKRVRTEETLRIRVDETAQAGAVKVPTIMRPPISKGRDGWWDFTELAVTDDEIRGKISMNFVNKPKLSIDRRTGDVDMKGLGMRFTGNCERAPEITERKF